MIESLNSQFGLEGRVRFEAGNGGLPKAILASAAGATGEVYLHGAHVTSFCPTGGDEVLWMSGESSFSNDSPIRGGVPICWPWFGPAEGREDLPQHGFARTSQWSVGAVSENKGDAESELTIDLILADSEATRSLWPHEFDLRMRVSIGTKLSLSLTCQNNSSNAATVGTALHTYFGVGDIDKVRVSGLSGRSYIDKLDEMQVKPMDGDVRFDREVDRVYLDTADEVSIHDASRDRTILVNKTGSLSTVVWNPWVAKSQHMGDFPDDGYQTMVCIEATNAGPDVRSIAPGESHTIGQVCSIAGG